MVRVCVLFAAGTNCDAETAWAFKVAGAAPDTVHINRFRAGEVTLDDYHVLAIPGGFSYGDYIASGRILANEIKHHLREQIERFLEKGKLVIGICNGFQVLVKSGLLPGFERPFEEQTVTLDWNDSARYEDRWVWLSVEDSPCVFTRGLESPIFLPVAHAEGRFLTLNEQVLARLNANRQVALRYTTEAGEPPEYPDDPNGSVEHIAGVCDPSGRVFGLMPHPERFMMREHHPYWQRLDRVRIDGRRIFENAVQYAKTTL
jgi:phosphoribosylformylglycinamidine synthase